MEEEKTTKKLLLTIAIVAILILSVFYLTYSMVQNSTLNKIRTSIIKLDEDAYGDTEFNNSNLILKPILDKDVNKDSNNLIYIEFNVGGSKENDTDE